MSRSTRITKRPYRVDFYHNLDDRECGDLLAMGRTTKSIERETGLTPGKISYRAQILKRAGVPTRAEFRNGIGKFAQIVAKKSREEIDRELIRYLNKNL
jgi:hypothetical protein